MTRAAGRWIARLSWLFGKPPSDWMGADPAQAAAVNAGPIERDDWHEIVWFPPPHPADTAVLRPAFPSAGGLPLVVGSPLRVEREVAARLAQEGHRVFAISDRRAEGAGPFELSEVAPRLFEVALSDSPLEGLDALRRDLSLGATVCVVEDPARLPLAELLEAEENWPIARDLSRDLARAFPLVSIIVVTYNNRDLNRLCLESVAARTEWPNREILVVDNGSTDGTRELLEELAGKIRDLSVIALGENRGYPAAVNVGLARATGASILLLNNDTVVTRSSTTALLRHLRHNARLGLVGPVTNAIANEARIDVGYSDLAELPAWAAGWVRAHDGETFAIPTLAFFCMAVRREVLEAVGPLDERFGLGMFEDGDYCRRVRAAGWQIRCARDSFVHHWQMASFRKLGKDEYLRVFEENRRKFEEKWGRGS